MDATAIRNENWDKIQARLEGVRYAIWQRLSFHGPATTSQLAAAMDISILTVRPRVTELVQAGFAECIGREGKEGIYQGIPVETALAAYRARNEQRRPVQAELPL